MSDDLIPPPDAVKWAYWFLEPPEMQKKSSPNSGPYMNYLRLAEFLVECDMADIHRRMGHR